jgi:hypothetical protein
MAVRDEAAHAAGTSVSSAVQSTKLPIGADVPDLKPITNEPWWAWQKPSTRAKWRSCPSTCHSVLARCLTLLTLLERRYFNNNHIVSGLRPLVQNCRFGYGPMNGQIRLPLCELPVPDSDRCACRNASETRDPFPRGRCPNADSSRRMFRHPPSMT